MTTSVSHAATHSALAAILREGVKRSVKVAGPADLTLPSGCSRSAIPCEGEGWTYWAEWLGKGLMVSKRGKTVASTLVTTAIP
jgi:hypothetical protein